MKAAICSDIHGDLPALEAVLAAAANVGADEIWVVGDLVAHGPHPGPVVRRLRSLDEEPMAGRLRVVRGNTDRYVVSGDLSPYLLAIDRERVPDKERLISDAHKAFAWTRDRVEEEGCLDWLAGLPAERSVDLPDGSRVLMVHAAPGTDDGPGLYAELTDDDDGEPA